MGDMRSVPEPSSAVGSPATGRDPWAGFGAGPSSRPRRPSGGNGGGDPDDERAVVDLTRRLHDRVDGQEALLDRVADLAQHPDDRARVSELRDATRRVRRDSEALLLLCGADPGVPRGAHTVAAVLGDALAVTDDPSRAAQRSVPDATLTAAAAVELRHLVAELVDEAAAASPGARVEVGARREPDGALVVEVVAAGQGWPDALGGARRGAFGAPRLAERLARRSTGGIRLERPLIDQVDGLVATLHCPAALVTGPPGGDPWQLSGLSSAPSRPVSSLSSASLSSASLGSGFSSSMLSTDPDAFLLGTTALPLRSGQDELFGPLPAAVGAIGTPIFEAVASAWFRDDERGPAEDDWSSPGDREWRAAAARATRTDTPSTTASGLPRRSPGDRLVPPPRASQQAPTGPDERVPERVRDRLSTYQRGLQQGRHRATDPVPADPAPDGAAPEAWTAEGW
jgi:two-component sensor histidine kinase